MSKSVLSKVCDIVADHIGVTHKVLKSNSRKQHLVYGRMMLSEICQYKYKIEIDEIANFFNQSNASIYHYNKVFRSEIKYNSTFQNDYKSILERINKNKALMKGGGVKTVQKINIHYIIKTLNQRSSS